MQQIARSTELDRTVDSDQLLTKRRQRHLKFWLLVEGLLDDAEHLLAVRRNVLTPQAAVRRCYVERTVNMVRTLMPLVEQRSATVDVLLALMRDRSMKLLLMTTDDGAGDSRLLHVGRYEQRCLALLWYLAGCAVRKQISVLLLSNLLQVANLASPMWIVSDVDCDIFPMLQCFSADEQVQILDVLERTETFDGMQWFCVADATAMRRFVQPGA